MTVNYVEYCLLKGSNVPFTAMDSRIAVGDKRSPEIRWQLIGGAYMKSADQLMERLQLYTSRQKKEINPPFLYIQISDIHF